MKGKRGLEKILFPSLLFVAFFCVLIVLSIVFAEHTTSPATMTINQSQYYIFNISINNTNVGTTGNITQVNITLPSGFLFVAGSNGTYNAIGNFTNTSTVLSWTNTTNYLINGTTNNTYFWFNATAQASLVPSGNYNISITSLNGTGTFQTNLSVKVNDINAPVINLITPTSGNTTTPTSVIFSFNVTDDSTISNCSLILNGISINTNNSGTNRTGGTTSFVNISYVVSNTWNITCRDIDNNAANSSTRSFSLLSFGFNGTTRDENGNILNNSVVNITIRSQQGWTTLAYTSGTSNASGWFNFSIASNSSWMYEPAIKHTNITTTPNFVDFKSKTIPAFPSMMIQMLAGATFYLTPAGTINITAINATGGRIPFQYQIKDTALGYPIAEDHTNWVSEINVFVPKNRNYSIMVYPNQSMPVSFNWNNFSSSTPYNLTGAGTNPTINASKYLADSSTLHKQFNTSLTMVMVTGYINNASGYPMNSTLITWNNFTVIPFLLEPGNMIHSEYGDMPYNLSSSVGRSDFFNLTTGFYNISLPGTAETSNVILFATALNGSSYYGGFRNISPSYGDSPINSFNFTMYGLLGTASNITMDQFGGAAIAIPTAKQTFNLVNATNSTLSSTFAHIETSVDYSSSSIGAIEFTWMSDVQQSQATATFSLPLLNVTGIKEMNVFASGGPGGNDNGQYAPKRVSTQTAAQIILNNNITIREFNPQAIGESLEASSITMALYTSNSSCDVPNPASSCLLGSSSSMANFDPIKSVMGGGKISFRMGTGNILIHYVNVDMLASGPPDVLFDSATNTNGTAGSSFASALRFGSQGPTIYDYALVSIPYTETAGSGLNESAPVNISIPLLYDDNWNVIWNTTANGTASGALAGNFSHYSSKQSEWGNLTVSGGKLCNTANVTSAAQLNATEPCYIDNSSNRIWVRLPHFSGTGPSVSGSVVASAASTTTTTTGGGGGAGMGQNKTKSQSWTKITPGAATIMKSFDKDLGIKQITIEVNNPAQNVKITVTKYSGLPAEVSVEKTGKVYKYLQINTTNLAENLSKAIIKIQVEKSWLSNNGLDKDKIAMFKFDDNSDKWNELTTTYKEEDSTNYYYDTELTSFSYFAIGEKVVAEEVEEEAGEEGGAEEEIPEEEAEKSNLWLWILITIIVIAIIIGVIIAIKRKS